MYKCIHVIIINNNNNNSNNNASNTCERDLRSRGVVKANKAQKHSKAPTGFEPHDQCNDPSQH